MKNKHEKQQKKLIFHRSPGGQLSPDYPIITDHDYHNIIDIATRVLLIHDGGTKEIKNKDELIFWGYIPESA